MKTRFSLRFILPHEVCIKEFQVLRGQSSCNNRNKFKNLIFVGSILHICQLDIRMFKYKLMYQSTLYINFLYVWEFNSVKSWNKGKSIILVRLSFQISLLEILVSYSMLAYVNVNMSVPNSNFEGNFSTYVFGKSF